MSVDGDSAKRESSQATNSNVVNLKRKLSIDERESKRDCCQTTDSNVEILMENLIPPHADDEDFCLLDTLANVPDVAYIVISMLEHEDVVNLALVCKKWYRTIINAPKSTKPVITVDVFYLKNKNRTAGFTQIIDNRLLKQWRIPMDNVFNMIRLIDSKFLEAYCMCNEETPEKSEEYFNELNELFKFLLIHRNEFCFVADSIQFDYPTFAKIDYSLLSKVFTEYTTITTKLWNDNWELPVLWRQEFQQVVLESVTLEYLKCDFSLDKEFLHDFLMQIVNGQRPNFKFWEVQYSEEDDEEFIRQALRDIDPSRYRQIDEEEYEIDVSSSKKITFTVDSDGWVRLEKTPYYD